MLELHIRGGMEWMFPLTIIFLIILGLIGYVLYCRFSNKLVHPNRLEAIKHIGMFALAWGVLATVYGLYAMFKDLQALKQVPPLEVLMGGLQALLIALLYSLIIYIISLIAYLVLKLKTRNTTDSTA